MSNNVRIGTIVGAADAARVIPQILPYGFESFSLTFWDKAGNVDLKDIAKKVKDAIGDKDAVVSTVSIFGNPLMNKDTAETWKTLIDNAHLFGTDLVTGFTGRVVNKPIDESIPKFKEVFGELGKRAKDKGVRLAFENCSMGGNWATGDWNIAHNPAAWEMMFDAVPLDNLGFQWEPCHQMVCLIDPIPQLRKWIKRMFCLHGKDATIAWDVVKEHGIYGPHQFAWHRTPGFGDSNWADIITILRQGNFKGSIDIEGYHDPVYREELEWTGQVRALRYLKECRGGDFVPNPK
jgi:sugar phosphate isomerase/epimerase